MRDAPRWMWIMTVKITHGVDFSGAKGGGGAKIVVASCGDSGEVSLERGLDRNRLVARIRETLADGDRHLWRIDAPFSVPEAVFDAHELEKDWLSLAHWMRQFDDPRAWRRALRAVDRKEKKRLCDRAAHAPLAPMNLRVFKQTWTVVCEVLLPLVSDEIDLPCLRSTDAPVSVVESCPASVLHRMGESSRGYKGRTTDNQIRRRALLQLLEGEGLEISSSIGRRAIEDSEGDVLDALLLLLAPVSEATPVQAGCEGWIW